MSAFICSRTHIASIAKYIHSLETLLSPEDIATILMRENERSVNHRYSETNEPEPVFTPRDIEKAPDLTDGAALKAINCLNYQCCETDDWESTTAFKITQSIEKIIEIKSGKPAVELRLTKEYQEAKWGI